MPSIDETVKLPRPQGIPDPMRPLGSAGVELWERVWTAGAVWLADRIDSETLLVLCEQVDERAALRVEVFKTGDPRSRTALRALDKQVMLGLAMLGFNPVDRARMGVAEVEQDSLDDFMARRQQQKKSS